MGYRNNYPANIESPYRVFFQYSSGINWDWTSGRYPTGREDGWIWEEKFIPVTHKYGGVTVGPHRFMRIRIGSGKWSMPIRIVGEDGQDGDDAENVNEPSDWVQTIDDLRAYDLSIVSDGTRVGVFGNENIYEYDADSEKEDDGEDVLKPDNHDSPGRWIKVATTSLLVASQSEMENIPMTINTKAVSPALLQHWLDYHLDGTDRVVETEGDGSGNIYLVAAAKNTAYNKDFASDGTSTLVARADAAYQDWQQVTDNGNVTDNIVYPYMIQLTNQDWTESTSISDDIYSLVVYNGKLYAGTSSNGRIFEYDGSNWVEFYNSSEYEIWSLAVYNNRLYAGSGDNGKVFEYDGSSWTESTATGELHIKSLAIYNNELYAGSGANGKIFKYDGSAWTESTTTSEYRIESLETYNGKLYAGTGDNGKIFEYNGNSWTESTTISETNIHSLTVYNGKLYAGTEPSGKIFECDGNTWSELTATSEDYIYSLIVYNNKLYIGSGTNGKIFEYDGNVFTEVNNTGQYRIHSLGVYNGKLYAGSDPSGKIFEYSETFDFFNDNDKPIENQYHYWSEKNEFKQNPLVDGTDNFVSFNITDGSTSTIINNGDNLVIQDGSNTTVTENDGTFTIDVPDSITTNSLSGGTGIDYTDGTITHKSASIHELGGSLEITHNNLSINSDDHHTQYTDGSAIAAINNDTDHGSTASHNYSPNYYATDVSGNGDGTITITMDGTDNITTDLSHNHDSLYDDYGSFNITDGSTSTAINSGDSLSIVGDSSAGINDISVNENDGTVIIESTGRVPYDSIDGTDVTQNTIFNAFHYGALPNKGDEIIVSGGIVDGSETFIISRAKKDTDLETFVYLYYVSGNGSIGKLNAEDQDTTTYDYVSISF